jgi:hypothetical protein
MVHLNYTAKAIGTRFVLLRGLFVGIGCGGMKLVCSI